MDKSTAVVMTWPLGTSVVRVLARVTEAISGV